MEALLAGFSFLVLFLFTVFFIFPFIGEAMKFIINHNTETNEYRANLLNGFVIILFLCGILTVLYSIGFIFSVGLALVW
jgi:hypothetical protein